MFRTFESAEKNQILSVSNLQKSINNSYYLFVCLNLNRMNEKKNQRNMKSQTKSKHLTEKPTHFNAIQVNTLNSCKNMQILSSNRESTSKLIIN